MKKVVTRVLRDRPDLKFQEIDISTDPDLEARFGLEIPVLLMDGRKAAKYQIEERALRRMLGSR